MSGIKQHIPLFSIDGLGQSVACRDTGDESLEESQREPHGCKFSLIARSIYEATVLGFFRLEFWSFGENQSFPTMDHSTYTRLKMGEECVWCVVRTPRSRLVYHMRPFTSLFTFLSTFLACSRSLFTIKATAATKYSKIGELSSMAG
jgi:hypothetical protein